jgi:hypothetical protein
MLLECESRYDVSPAAEALGRIGTPNAVAALIKGMFSSSNKEHCAYVLRELAHPDSVAAFLEVLEGSSD